MASGFFMIFDDVATLLNDVAAMSKVATKKTAGVLGDDLAVNSEKTIGFASSRELPVIWTITKGSLLNKFIILPFVLTFSEFAPWAIIPILMCGGAFLAYEGVEKIYEFLFHKEDKKKEKSTDIPKTEEEILAQEKTKVKSAIFTDFILSLEIIILTLSVVLESPLKVKIPVLIIVSVLATIGVYGIVALIVRMDDFGFRLIVSARRGSLKFKIGYLLVHALPIVIKVLSVVGTIAMLLVAGGIFMHNVTYLHDFLHALPSLLAEFLVGLSLGIILFLIIHPIVSFISKRKRTL